VSAFMIVWLNASIAPGAFKLGSSGEPLLDGFKSIYGESIAKLLALVAVLGLIASFHTIIFAFGRQIYSLSRAGYFPAALSVTHGTRKTPHIALIAGAVLGFVVMLLVWFVSGAEEGAKFIGGTLLNMAVFGAMISYVLQGISFILLRRNMPDIERPYRSPLGVPGAVLTVVIAVVTLYYQLADPVYRTGVYFVAGWYVLWILYFALIGRNKLVLSPEEKFAMTGGKAGYESH
jgi:ethanolamine permease